MGIFRNFKGITDIYKGGRALQRVYKGTRLVWQKIKDILESCFGNGYWLNDKPWNNEHSWKNDSN